ncbi:phosphatidylserine/phosphatidylglycerophosphate/cardiolipin synthase family protein [Pedobacter frigiditerrae]|uniref:phospholipase D n=1 Tax=Pedobacter frigiditerrae TaxID=2530452 RepID=A0A4R0N261_9SPHI|nr:phospholipase D-like domain-containing protein [Pedobacter frigiditerrae]TCC92404.1 phosphatidylserine/phosphatidylglycerophosphate/cardiolipin synthase family protein [Pedobacter frigiditerrae]
MEFSIQQSDCFKTGFFLQNKQKADYSPFQGNDELFLTQEGNASLKEEILKLIDQAERVIKVCSFIITDREVFQVLLEKVKSRRIAVFVLTQLDPTKLKNTMAMANHVTDEELSENPAHTHLYHIKALFDQGAHVRAATTAHAKFLLIDRKMGLLMSANLTTPSLNLNTESGIYVDNDTVAELDRLFDIIFQHGTRYRQYFTASKSKAFVVSNNEHVSTDYLLINPSGRLRYTYEQHTHHLYETMLEYVNQATEYVYISTYSIVGLEKLPAFTRAVEAAVSRGVSISIFCRGMNYRSDHLKNTLLLAQLGCKVYGDVYNHSKGIINENTGMIFTANIDGNHGLINGLEVGYVLNKVQRAAFLDFHLTLIGSSPYVFHTHPQRAELFKTYGDYEVLKGLKPPVFPDELEIHGMKSIRLAEADFKRHAIFYARQQHNNFLVIGPALYRCQYQSGKFTILSREEFRTDLEKYILKFNNLKITLN